MTLPSLFAFYGSLRRGMSNYGPYAHGLRFLRQEVWKGYRLYALEYYPYAVRTGNSNDLLTVEIFEVTDEAVAGKIHELEMGAGYFLDTLIIQGQPIGLYLYQKAGDEPLVPGGDWVEFFGRR